MYPWWCAESFDDWHLHSVDDFVRAMRSELFHREHTCLWGSTVSRPGLMSDTLKLYPFLLHKFLFQKEAIVLITQFDPCICSWWDVSDPKALIRPLVRLWTYGINYHFYCILYCFYLLLMWLNISAEGENIVYHCSFH